MAISNFSTYKNAKNKAEQKTATLLQEISLVIDREYSDPEIKDMLKREIAKANEEISKTYYELEICHLKEMKKSETK
tara:strand:- start:557 stop:787 length:231 start_codon:yes stop_codon:yes gene_type:complete